MIMNITKKFDKLFEQMVDEKFLKMEALGGEVPFFITSYDIKEQENIYKEIERLKNRLQKRNIKVSMIHLYDIVIEILQERKLLDKILEKEKEIGKERLLITLKSLLDVPKTVVPKIASKSQSHQIVFLYSIGEVYPYIRSHTILNNLQSHITDKPLVMFFPGVYTGTQLSLFGMIKDDNYYRAFNLDSLIKDHK